MAFGSKNSAHDHEGSSDHSKRLNRSEEDRLSDAVFIHTENSAQDKEVLLKCIKNPSVIFSHQGWLENPMVQGGFLRKDGSFGTLTQAHWSPREEAARWSKEQKFCTDSRVVNRTQAAGIEMALEHEHRWYRDIEDQATIDVIPAFKVFDIKKIVLFSELRRILSGSASLLRAYCVSSFDDESGDFGLSVKTEVVGILDLEEILCDQRETSFSQKDEKFTSKTLFREFIRTITDHYYPNFHQKQTEIDYEIDFNIVTGSIAITFPIKENHEDDGQLLLRDETIKLSELVEHYATNELGVLDRREKKEVNDVFELFRRRGVDHIRVDYFNELGEDEDAIDSEEELEPPSLKITLSNTQGTAIASGLFQFSEKIESLVYQVICDLCPEHTFDVSANGVITFDVRKETVHILSFGEAAVYDASQRPVAHFIPLSPDVFDFAHAIRKTT